jgi:hypothetical protein
MTPRGLQVLMQYETALRCGGNPVTGRGIAAEILLRRMREIESCPHDWVRVSPTEVHCRRCKTDRHA